MTAKTTAQRQAEFRARQQPEVRGIFAHPDDRGAIKAEAARLAKWRAKVAKSEARIAALTAPAKTAPRRRDRLSRAIAVEAKKP